MRYERLAVWAGGGLAECPWPKTPRWFPCALLETNPQDTHVIRQPGLQRDGLQQSSKPTFQQHTVATSASIFWEDRSRPAGCSESDAHGGRVGDKSCFAGSKMSRTPSRHGSRRCLHMRLTQPAVRQHLKIICSITIRQTTGSG